MKDSLGFIAGEGKKGVMVNMGEVPRATSEREKYWVRGKKGRGMLVQMGEECFFRTSREG